MSDRNTVVTANGAVGLVDAGASHIPNKPTEPPFRLGTDINKCVFKCDESRKPAWIPLKIFNLTEDTISFKIRCTSSAYFRVQPPTGVLEPNDCAEIKMWFNNSVKPTELNGKHYFALYHYKGDFAKDKSVFAPSNVDGVRRLPAMFDYPGVDQEALKMPTASGITSQRSVRSVRKKRPGSKASTGKSTVGKSELTKSSGSKQTSTRSQKKRADGKSG